MQMFVLDRNPVDAAKAAMIVEMKHQKAQHEKAILDFAAVMAKHSDEIDRLGMLLDLYEESK